MHRTAALLGFCAAVIAAGCSSSASPAEVSDEAKQFPVVAHWTAGAAPIAPATVAGQLTFDQRLGYHGDVTFVVTGPPNGVFQWRIFKRDCSVNVAASGTTAFTGLTGLTLFATTASYPDITLDAAGKATIKTAIAGWLDSLTAYSVRIRPTATTTFTGVNPASCGNLKYAPAS
jgi:FtsH-binding integral membrane protein